MKFSTGCRVCAIVVSLAALGTFASVSNAQCACGSSGAMAGIAIEGGMDSVPLGPEALLDETDDPTKIVNLTVVVHDKALVIINGEPTVTMGTVRPYIVRGLKPGKTYKFQLEAVLRQPKGDVYVAKEAVEIKAGDSKQVVMHVRRANRVDYPPPPPPPPAIPVAVPPAK